VALALSVAKEFVRLSLSGEEADPLSRLRLEKLLYYAQAWSLVIRQSELFADDVEAWRLGPVVPAVNDLLPDVSICDDEFSDAPDLGGDEADFVGPVWDAYKRHSATRLAEMTSEESPWRDAWANGEGKEPISVIELEEYFAKQEMPAPLAAYAHERRRREEEAIRILADVPPLDVGRLTSASKSFTPSVNVQQSGGG